MHAIWSASTCEQHAYNFFQSVHESLLKCLHSTWHWQTPNQSWLCESAKRDFRWSRSITPYPPNDVPIGGEPHYQNKTDASGKSAVENELIWKSQNQTVAIRFEKKIRSQTGKRMRIPLPVSTIFDSVKRLFNGSLP